MALCLTLCMWLLRRRQTGEEVGREDVEAGEVDEFAEGPGERCRCREDGSEAEEGEAYASRVG